MYLKEPYQLIWDWDSEGEPLNVEAVEYKFDRENLDPEFEWENKLFMPEKYARHFIKITGVSVEILQRITRTSIRKEGLVCPEHLKSDDSDYNYRQWYYEEWKRLWNSINKDPGTAWEDNPLVWVYEFELINKPIK